MAAIRCDETGLKSPIFYSEDFAIDGAAMPEKLCALQWKASSQRMSRRPYRLGRNEAWLKIKCLQRAKFPIVGFVKDPAGVAALPLAKRERKDFVYAAK
jgi:bifunctional non-homologous end joining protein LigD